jgi:hypothetical protein
MHPEPDSPWRDDGVNDRSILCGLWDGLRSAGSRPVLLPGLPAGGMALAQDRRSCLTATSR